MNKFDEYATPLIKELKRSWRKEYESEVAEKLRKQYATAFDNKEKMYKEIIERKELDIKKLKDELSYFNDYDHDSSYNPQVSSGVIKQHIKDELRFLLKNSGMLDPLEAFYSLLDLYLPDGLWGVENGE